MSGRGTVVMNDVCNKEDSDNGIVVMEYAIERTVTMGS